MLDTLPVWIPPFIGGLIVGAVVAWLWRQARAQQEISQLKVELAKLEQARTNDEEKLRWQEQAVEKLREAFTALSSQALQNNNDEFLKRAKEQVGGLLEQVRGDWQTHKVELNNLFDPLDKSLTRLDGQIQEIERKREGAYRGLEEQLRQLATTHNRLQSSTDTLSQALKSSSALGRWGEIQLQRVVEMAGLVKHVDFQEQQESDGGARPDMIVTMPNGGLLPIDAKTSLKAYLEAVAACDESTRQAKLDEHVKAIQAQVRLLEQKKYWAQFSKAPDFVIMFVPSEAGLYAAFERDPKLLDYALERRVLIATPITLLALLKAIAYGWQQHQITDHIQQIVEESRELYKRLKTFVDHLEDLGKSMNKSVQDYNQAIGSLEHRVLPAARRLQEMGSAASELIEIKPIEAGITLPSLDDTGPDTGQMALLKE